MHFSASHPLVKLVFSVSVPFTVTIALFHVFFQMFRRRFASASLT